MNPQFNTVFAEYLTQAKQARDQNQHHDFRRQLFLSFLQKAFDIELSDIEVERYVQIANQQVPVKGIARIRKGWIDAVFNDLIFEFKRDLAKEEAEGLRELRDYLSTIPNGNECIGLLTDGLFFTAYVLEASQPHHLRKIDSINLEGIVPQLAYLWLDAYLLRQSNTPPSSADIVRRFGLLSPTFVATAKPLREALKVFSISEAGAFEVKRQQWAFHLARVYGNADISNDEMFIRHTYLCQFAKILAHASYFGVSDTTKHVEGIINGRAFQVLGVSNIGEQDFFAWVLAPEVRSQTLDVFRRIAESLVVYNLKQIDEDLLKQLYQNLVEPETRHELGEFYTPDWLAELALREIGYHPGQSLLDPACGSGTFLFTAIRLLSEQGMKGQALVDFALEHIMGIDVHPLAVTIAKINYMLAILPHLRSGGSRRLRMIPISMANALQVPSKSYHIEVIEVPIDLGASFKIPAEAARHPNELVEVLEEMGRYAKQVATIPNQAKFGDFSDFAITKLSGAGSSWDTSAERTTWSSNARQLAKQIKEGRDTIWGYVLQNTSRPLVLSYRKFDVVAGNPPWIAYRFIQDQTYQGEIKKLIREYELLAANEMKLNTQMELATLFFEHCRRMYLKPEGTIAFVMPRSVITGAKQHHAFQQQGFSRILDLKQVAPLFGVETCVMIRNGNDIFTQVFPTVRFAGVLPAHECTWSEATKVLTRTNTTTDFVKQETIASPYYYPRFLSGANLYPRNLVYVTSAQPDLPPGELAFTPIMHTDPDINGEAKEPWKDIIVEGHIDDDFLYATLLSKNVVPFGIRKLHLVAVPVRVGLTITNQLATSLSEVRKESFIPMSREEIRDNVALARSADDWFEQTEQLWKKYKKATTKETLAQWINFQNKIIAQSPNPGYLVLYGAAGSNISACVIDTQMLPVINGVQPKAFIADVTTYWYRSSTKEEAYFLSAMLNAPCVDNAIKAYQTRGIYVGPRHIHRRPFEVCTIPQYDPNNPQHQQLTALSQAAQTVVATLDLSEGGVVAARKRAREAAYIYFQQIDEIAQRMLGLTPTSDTQQEDTSMEEEAI